MINKATLMHTTFIFIYKQFCLYVKFSHNFQKYNSACFFIFFFGGGEIEGEITLYKHGNWIYF